MNYCGNCGAKINENGKFCGNCGKEIRKPINNQVVMAAKVENKKIEKENNTIPNILIGVVLFIFFFIIVLQGIVNGGYAKDDVVETTKNGQEIKEEV